MAAGHAVEPEHGHQPKRPFPEEEAEETADGGKEHRLGQELAAEPPEARAEGLAGRHLSRAATGAHEHQVGDVEAPDEEHEKHATPEQEQHRLHVLDDVLLEWHDGRVEAGILQDLVELREARVITPIDGVHLRLRPLDGDTRFEHRDPWFPRLLLWRWASLPLVLAMKAAGM